MQWKMYSLTLPIFCVGFTLIRMWRQSVKPWLVKKNAWDSVKEAWGSLVDCPSKQDFDESLVKFEIACSPWPMFVDFVKQTWLIPHKEKFVKVWMNKEMHLGNTTTNRYENCKFFCCIIRIVNPYNAYGFRILITQMQSHYQRRVEERDLRRRQMWGQWWHCISK